MTPEEEFQAKRAEEINRQGGDRSLKRVSKAWLRAANAHRYSYHFEWMGRPIIQYPQDIVAMQEIIWRVRPDLIIETGIARGGSLVLNASMLALLDYDEAHKKGEPLDPQRPRRRVLGIDIEIRPHNRFAIEGHSMANRIDMIEGSSVSPEIVARVREKTRGCERVMVCLDSNHTQEHVLLELEAYAPLVSIGCYCVVFDTVIEDLPEGMFPDRPWGKGDNPKTAVTEYLRRLRTEGRKATADSTPLAFEIDKSIESKLLITVAPDGYLKRVA